MFGRNFVIRGMKTFYQSMIIPTLLTTIMSCNVDSTPLTPHPLLELIPSNTTPSEIEKIFQDFLKQNVSTFNIIGSEYDWSRILSDDLLGSRYVIAALQWSNTYHFLIFGNPSHEDITVQVEFPACDNYSRSICPEGKKEIVLRGLQVQVLNFACDITGTYVESSGNISVLSMSSFLDTNALLIEQLLPIKLWGTYYVVKPCGNSSVTEIILLLTVQDNTNVHILGYDYVTIQHKYNWIQRRIFGTSPVTIKTSKPVSVTQFFLAKEDNAMVNINPMKYRIDKKSIENYPDIQYGYLHTNTSQGGSIDVPLTQYYKYKYSDYSAMPDSVLSCTMWHKEKHAFPVTNCGYLDDSQTETLWPLMVPSGDNNDDRLLPYLPMDSTTDNVGSLFVIPIIDNADVSLSCHVDNVDCQEYYVYNKSQWEKIDNESFPISPLRNSGYPITIYFPKQNDGKIDMLLCRYKLSGEEISNVFLVPSVNYLQTEYVAEFPEQFESTNKECKVAGVFNDTSLIYQRQILYIGKSQQRIRNVQARQIIAASHIISVQCYINEHDKQYYVHHPLPISGNQFNLTVSSPQNTSGRRLLITSTDSNTVVNVSTRNPADCECNGNAPSLYLLIDTAGFISELTIEDENATIIMEITSNKPVSMMVFFNISTSGSSSSFRYDSLHLTPTRWNNVWNEQTKPTEYSFRKRKYGLVSYQVPGDGEDNDQDGLVDEEYCGFLWGDYELIDLDLDGSVYEDCKGCFAGQELDESFTCQECKVGYYREESSKIDVCRRCGGNMTTFYENSISPADCIPICEEGMQLDNETNTCEPCSVGFYKKFSANETELNTTDRFWCKGCPENKTTYDTGTHLLQLCIDHCEVGMYLNGSTCQKCDLGYYKNTSSRNVHIGGNQRWNCTKCPTGKTTLSTGANKCIEICPEGKEFNSTSGKCNPCKLGFYKNISGSHVGCFECPFNYTTRHVGATDVSKCKLANCMCPCSRVHTPKNFTSEELAATINMMKKKLQVNTSQLSSTYRKKNSIVDKRPSSQSIGAFGVLVITLVFVVLIAFDFGTLVRQFSELLSTIKNIFIRN